MIQNYFKTAWRNLKRNKTISAINLLGLSIGMAAVILISLYVFKELNYDRFHKNIHNITRIDFKYYSKGILEGEGSEFVAAFAPEAKAALPEIKSFCRISSARQVIASTGTDKFIVDNICFADSSFFRMFSFKLTGGNPLTVLQNPFSIVITKDLADKLFNKKNALGKTLTIDGANVYTITGIAEKPPTGSSIQFNAIISFATLSSLYPKTQGWDFLGWNGGNQFITYFQLYSPLQKKQLASKLPGFLWEKINQQFAKAGAKIVAAVHPLNKVHLWHNEDSKITRTNLYVFGIVGILILIISVVNYININTAQAFSRFKEIGVRKVFGASKNQIIKQSIGESVFMILFSFLISLAIVVMFSFTSEAYTTGIFLSTNNILLIALIFIALLLIVGCGAGSYMAFYLSSLNITGIFKSNTSISKTGFFKNALIVFQFAISIALIAVTLIVSHQVGYLKTKPLGFDKEKILVVSLNSGESVKNEKLLKEKIENLSGVVSVSGSSEVPYNGFTGNGFLPDDRTDYITPRQLAADKDFLKTFQIKMNGSADALQQFEDRQDICFINQALANSLGWPNPVGRKLKRDTLYTIAGVVNNFNYASLHYKIEPLVITKAGFGMPYTNLSVKYNTHQPQLLVKQIKSIWPQIVSDAPLDYWFLDNAFNKLYQKEEKFQFLFMLFSVISVMLSLAGIFGLVSINLNRRIKEIGIRKVLGANMSDLLKIVLSKYALIVLVSTALAVPAAWMYMNKWLRGFEYRVDIKLWFFIVSFLLVMAVTVLVIGFQTIKATLANPVKSLRTE